MFIGTLLWPAINAAVYLISYYKHCTNRVLNYTAALFLSCVNRKICLLFQSLDPH